LVWLLLVNSFVLKLKTMTDYERIKKAIEFIRSNFQQQPDLDAVAKEVYLSPFHFSDCLRLGWGKSKKFLQYISLQHAKKAFASAYCK
jgi:AraC family transcriptional regulator of adaptative response/methylated-DNA-[protein]-cysteine methyltransferase